MAGAAAMIREQLEEDDPLQAEAKFIALWNQGLEIAAIAQRLGIPKRTVQSRVHRPQQRGLIQPRPGKGVEDAGRHRLIQSPEDECWQGRGR
jgi:transposase